MSLTGLFKRHDILKIKATGERIKVIECRYWNKMYLCVNMNKFNLTMSKIGLDEVCGPSRWIEEDKLEFVDEDICKIADDDPRRLAFEKRIRNLNPTMLFVERWKDVDCMGESTGPYAGSYKNGSTQTLWQGYLFGLEDSKELTPS